MKIFATLIHCQQQKSSTTMSNDHSSCRMMLLKILKFLEIPNPTFTLRRDIPNSRPTTMKQTEVVEKKDWKNVDLTDFYQHQLQADSDISIKSNICWNSYNAVHRESLLYSRSSE